ncbi:MAG: ornithine cyclodeaminase [Maritimibacter sp.]
MSIEIIPAEAESLLDWRELTDALLAGHRMPRAELGDTFLYREPDTMLSRSAWIDGMGMAVKTATVFPDNRADNLPMVNGAVNLYSDDHGVFEAIVDFHLVTKWKTAADSLLAARLLAPEKADCILIIGAGEVAKSLREAYGALFPKARFMVWNRSSAGAEAMAANYPNTVVATDLESGVMASDIVTVFVDSRETVLNHIGELKIPLEAGVISRDHVAGDFYDIESGAFTREAEDITLFKNGGGAHLDLITSRYILDKWRNR